MSARAAYRCACRVPTSLAWLVLAASLDLAHAEHPRIAELRAAEQKTFTDEQITDGFFKIAFGAELAIAGRADRIRKYEQPVRVFVDSRAEPDRRRQVADVVADIATRIEHLDVAMTEERAASNVGVTLVRKRDFAATIRAFYGRDRARRIQRSLEPQCLSGFSKDEQYRIVHSDVILVVDAGDFIFYDCVYEELLQALGPINDDSSVPWTMFNDEVQKGFFDVYDQYLLNILYDPRIRPGMTREEVRAVLPQVLPSVRAFVAKVNSLEP
jgi:Protein of unknown function (DUF2927)